MTPGRGWTTHDAACAALRGDLYPSSAEDRMSPQQLSVAQEAFAYARRLTGFEACRGGGLRSTMGAKKIWEHFQLPRTLFPMKLRAPSGEGCFLGYWGVRAYQARSIYLFVELPVVLLLASRALSNPPEELLANVALLLSAGIVEPLP